MINRLIVDHLVVKRLGDAAVERIPLEGYCTVEEINRTWGQSMCHYTVNHPDVSTSISIYYNSIAKTVISTSGTVFRGAREQQGWILDSIGLLQEIKVEDGV